MTSNTVSDCEMSPPTRRKLLLFGAQAMCASLAACAGRPETGFLMAQSDSPEMGTTNRIIVATTRQRDARSGTFFGGDRSSVVNYARFTVSVPPTHIAGQVEWPKTLPGNPQTDFVIRDGAHLDDRKLFVETINQELKGKPPRERRVLLFIHGYNTLFSEGLYRAAQIANDSKSNAVPVLFTWASRGQVSDYVYDTNSATIARDGLEQTIRDILASSATEVNILAHSLGNWLLVETLRQIRISSDQKNGEKIGLVILAAPDIDVDVFKSQMARFGRPKRPFLIVLSRDDKALAFSRFIAGGQERLGAGADLAELERLGAMVIDLSDARGADSMNHGKFAELASVAPEMRAVLQRGISGGVSGGAHLHGASEDMGGLIRSSVGILGAPVRILGVGQR